MLDEFIGSKSNTKSVDLRESTDSLLKQSLEEFETKQKTRKLTNQFHEKVENQEQKDADLVLENTLSELSSFEFIQKEFPNNTKALLIGKAFVNSNILIGIPFTLHELKSHISNKLGKNEGLSLEYEIKTFEEQLLQQGKSTTQILQTLISKFENEKAVSTWVENWKNFLKLYQYAKNKPPTERRAIQNIIARADFTSENAFCTSLTKISNSTEISSETNNEIQRNFTTTGISTVRAFDQTLKNEKNFKKSIEKKIQYRNSDIENLNDEIQNLNNELDKLPPNDPKRSELEARIKEKSNLIESYEQELSVLNEAKPDKVQFQLRNNLMGVLNPDGSRNVRIISASFTIQLPSNKLPFSGMRNIRSINLAFPYLALRSQNIAGDIFSPNLNNKEVPNKKNRKMGHLILNSLGIDDTKILSEEIIKQLNSDLARLTSIPGKSGQECLIELGVYDITSQSLDKKRFADVLKFVCENRELESRLFIAKIKRQKFSY